MQLFGLEEKSLLDNSHAEVQKLNNDEIAAFLNPLLSRIAPIKTCEDYFEKQQQQMSQHQRI